MAKGFPFTFFNYHISLHQTKIRNTMKEIKTLGELIHEVVKKRKMTRKQLADKIYCNKENISRIYDKSSLSTDLLARICKALNYNFFDDIAKNLDLVKTAPEEELKLKTMYQFYECLPNALKKLGIRASLVGGNFSDPDESFPHPDFVLSNYLITFSYGTTLEQRIVEKFGKEQAYSLYHFKHFTDENDNKVTITTNILGSQSCDLIIEYKTEEAWEQTLRLALIAIKQTYTQATWKRIEELRK